MLNLDELIEKTPDGRVRTALVELKARAEAAEQRAEDKHRAWQAAEAEIERAHRWARVWKQVAKDYFAGYDEAVDTEAGTAILLDQAQAEVERLRAELARAATMPTKPWYE